ncbi:MAG: bifunctional folylpolyglutamate synthase/dihydrofolate synthase [Nitrospirales bacterium]|nr:bifunctional folylpolyglutamate synthase/dihydrofolate synthase [Nitrospira sp.]MDR4502261.1 bifunctional folylpolyglutamate synthase/dihydrofolate synthase [Nitrospirales bacterium]
MDYKDTIQFLYGLYRHGIRLGLQSISVALEVLHNPHLRYPSLHIGGTNGKGSTSAIAAAILQASGYRVGLYTSPHLVDFRERIRVDGQRISEMQVVNLARQVQATSPVPLTFFEFTTAMAFQYFSDREIDIAVVEVGMGGRFDATNVLSPRAVAITSIAHDHESYLGQHISEIAFEKAGIIKPNTPVIVGELPPDAEVVIQRIAAERQAPYFALGREFRIDGAEPGFFRYDGVRQRFPHLSCSLLGTHQRKNVGCALALLEQLTLQGFELREATVRSTLPEVVWEGRLEVLEDQPRLLIDGAHNVAAAQALVEALAPMVEMQGGRLITVLGMMRDKHHAQFMNTIAPYVSCLILTTMSVSRAATVDELKESVPHGLFEVLTSFNPTEALQLARQIAKPTDVICVTGSLFLVGEVRHLLVRTTESTSIRACE